MVYPSGFEPLTDCLEGSCAILLSHGYIYQFNQRETIHVLTSTVALKIASNWQVLWNSILQNYPCGALALTVAVIFESGSRIFGAHCRSRTYDPKIKSFVLYQLS